MKSKVELKFYCYLDEAGMQKHVLPPKALRREEEPEKEDDQGELDLAAEESPIGKVFAVSVPGSERTDNYLWVALAHSDGFICRSSEDGSNHVLTADQIQSRLNSGEYRESSKKMYNVMAKHKGTSEIEDDAIAEAQEDVVAPEESEETEVPVTADEPSVEDAVKTAVSELMTHLNQPLKLSGSDDGIWSNKILDGDVTMCKSEAHDLLDAEADGLRAVFVLTLIDKK